jgi:hypothetical protein
VKHKIFMPFFQLLINGHVKLGLKVQNNIRNDCKCSDDGLVAVLLALCFPLSPVQAQQERARSRLDWNRIGDEAITILSDYLRINTANPLRNEIEAAEFFGRIFDRGEIKYRIFQFQPGRATR